MVGTENPFGHALHELATSAGWNSSRHVSIDEVLEVADRAGYVLSDTTKKLLSNINGIVIKVCQRSIGIEANTCASIIEKVDIQGICEELGELFFPLGLASAAYLFVSDSGKVMFLDQDFLFFRVYSSIESLIRHIVLEQNADGLLTERYLELTERPEDFR